MKTFINIDDKAYSPFQPELAHNTEDYIELKPRNKNIALFYQFKITDSSKPFPVLPDGCSDFIFCCSSKKPFVILWTSPTERTTRAYLPSGFEYFGVRFYPDQKIFKLKFPMKELLNKIIPLEDVIQLDSYIVERIGATKSFLERISVFEMLFENRDSQSSYDQKIVEYSINCIYSSKGKTNIKRLSEGTGYSERYIRKIFEESVGFSPKQFCEIVRFQNSLDMILKKDRINLLDIVYENGYYDQAHFTKVFKKFANFTPIQFKNNFS